ncbi:MAG TPA: serine/threonine-protein kinase [Polyangia bacterium]|nr:serine/threonine-protein kinase [Polyangia bacterium]
MSDEPAPPDPRVGSTLQGRYLILSRLASGAMGVVYKGERVQLGRAVAVKFLHPWIAAQKTFLSRFENEAKAMSRLLHPNCVSVIDFGVEGSPYLVMDFVTGRTLRDLMLEGRLAPARTMRLAQQLLAGLAHAHEQGIVHRDLKPENLILSDEAGLKEHLRILDFGLAKLRDGPQMTAGMAVGTPSYMSPEQSGAEGAIDARTDLYTVGIVLFEMLTGRKPFQSDNVGEVILMQRESPPPKLRSVVPDARFSAELEALLDKAMSKLPEDRFQSAADLAAALAATPEGRAASHDLPVAAAAKAAPAKKPEPNGKPKDAAKPAPAPTVRQDAKTTVDTVSAVRRRLQAQGEPGLPGEQGQEEDKSARSAGAVRQFRIAWVGALFLGVALLALLIGRALRHGGDGAATAAARPSSAATGPGPVASAPHAPPAPGVVPAAAGTPGPESPLLEQARQMVARGEIDPAIALLNQLRAQQPDNADAPYLLAMIDFDNRRWPDGVAAAQIAVRKNPALKSDPDLIKGAIRSLASDRGYEKSQAFLRSLGPAATPFIKDAAAHDGSPKVRERAAELLSGGRGWGSRPSSGGSVFRR